MTDGIPVRLTAELVAIARIEAVRQERSLTQQVEHWARLGQVVESAMAASTVGQLKAKSHDPHLKERLAFAETAAGREKAAALIRERNPIRYGVDARGGITRAAEPRGPKTKRDKR